MFAAYSTVAVEGRVFHDSFGALRCYKDYDCEGLDRFGAAFLIAFL
jgi:hypothetical protein